MELLEDKYISHTPGKIRFAVSSPHYVFTTNAFVDVVDEFGKERFEFILHETTVHQILDDVKNRFSDLGIIYISRDNELAIRKTLEDSKLAFYPLFSVKPQVFIRTDHPLAYKSRLSLKDLQDYPRINFMQGGDDNAHFSEELYSELSTDKSIKLSDTGSLVNILIGTDAYTIAQRILPALSQRRAHHRRPSRRGSGHARRLCAQRKQELSDLGRAYIEKIKLYGDPATHKHPDRLPQRRRSFFCRRSPAPRRKFIGTNRHIPCNF